MDDITNWFLLMCGLGFGIVVQLRIAPGLCRTCEGDGRRESTCHYCLGDKTDTYRRAEPCRFCRGMGFTVEKCFDCRGTGEDANRSLTWRM